MTNNFSKFTLHFLHMPDMAWGSRVAVGVCLALSLLKTAASQTITPLYGNSGGKADAYFDSSAITPLDLTSRPGWVVTAACTASGNPFGLELAAWEDTGSALVKRGSYFDSSSFCYYVGIASLSNTVQGYTTVVTAVGSLLMVGQLQIAAWQVSPTGSISPLGKPAVDNSIAPDWVSIAPLSGSMRVVTAADNLGDYTLKVTAWQVSSTGDVKALSSLYKPNVYGYGSITSLNSSQAVTLDQNYSNDLEVISWGISSAGKLSQQSVAKAGVASLPTIATYRLVPTPSVVTASVDGSNDLELITWGVGSKGALTRQAAVTAGRIYQDGPALAVIPGDVLPFVAILDDNNLLDAEVFEQSGSSLKELTSYATAWSYGPQNPQGAAGVSTHRVVTAMIDTNNCDASGCELELEVWELGSSAPDQAQ